MPLHTTPPPCTACVRWLRRGIALALIGIACAYIGKSLGNGWSEMINFGYHLSAVRGSFLVIGVLGTLVFSTIYHVLLLRDLQPHEVPVLRVACAYAVGQIVRYIPGKVVGVIFQIRLLGNCIRKSNVVLSLLVQTAHDYAWTFAYCAIILWHLRKGSVWPLLLFPLVVIGLNLVHKYKLTYRLIESLPGVKRFIPSVSVFTKSDSAIMLTTVEVMVWLPMTAGLVIAFANLHGVEDALTIALLYLVAAVVSLALIVVPSGLVVREAVFLWLGDIYGFSPTFLLFFALVTRLAMTLAEVMNAVLFATLDAVYIRQCKKK